MAGKLVLASASQSRRMLLKNAGLAFESIPADIDERAIEGRMSDSADPVAVALELARQKALHVSARMGDAIVIGCDQTMSLGNEIFHKASSLNTLRVQLLRLAGQVHKLNSAVVLVRSGSILWEYVDSASLEARDFSSGFVDRYLKMVGDVVLDSVGGYQLEGPGIQLFSKISGDYFTILGLPLLPLLDRLRRMGEIDE